MDGKGWLDCASEDHMCPQMHLNTKKGLDSASLSRTCTQLHPLWDRTQGDGAGGAGHAPLLPEPGGEGGPGRLLAEAAAAVSDAAHLQALVEDSTWMEIAEWMSTQRNQTMVVELLCDPVVPSVSCYICKAVTTADCLFGHIQTPFFFLAIKTNRRSAILFLFLLFPTCSNITDSTHPNHIKISSEEIEHLLLFELLVRRLLEPVHGRKHRKSLGNYSQMDSAEKLSLESTESHFEAFDMLRHRFY